MISTFPENILSPVSSLLSMKYSTGYNILTPFTYETNYVLNNKLNILQYSGQFLENYNIMYCLIMIVLVIFAVFQIRISLL